MADQELLSLSINVDENGYIDHTYLRYFGVIHKALQWSGMWVTMELSKNKRSCCVNFSFIVLTILGIGYVLYRDVMIVYHDFMSYTKYELFNIMTALSRYFMFYVSRFFSFCYFSTRFDYPWLNVLNKNVLFSMNNQQENVIKKTMKRLTVIFILYLALYLLHIVFYYTYETITKDNDLLSEMMPFTETLCAAYTIFLPIIMCQICVSCIAVSYQICSIKVQNELNDNQTEQAIGTYKSNFNMFKKDCKFWVQIYMPILSVGYICFMWLYVDKLFFKPDRVYLSHIVSGMIFYTIPFIEYIACSLNLNHQHQLVLNELLDNYTLTDGEEMNRIHLYQFMSANPMVFTLCGVKINQKSIINFVVIFVISKFARYSYQRFDYN